MDERLFQEDRTHVQAQATVQVFSAGPMDLERGGHLPEVEIAYQTWGTLRTDASNAVLVCHALSGDSNAVGWWSRLVGPGLAIDTDEFFVIGSNVLGGCRGSTGPASLAADGRAYGSRFPQITIGDMVSAQRRLVSSLGISELALVCGGSMGGMQALEWARTGGVQRAWITASAGKHSAMQIGFNESARQAIMADEAWQGGDYLPGPGPRRGLAVARMLGHISYLSAEAFEGKFGRRRQDDDPETFQVESYLRYQGAKFCDRFDANSLIVLSRANDLYDCGLLAGSKARFLFTAFTSDWLYTPAQSAAMHAMALEAGCRSALEIIDLPYGHDAFLLDDQQQAAAVRGWLQRE